jgi:hypothetical protein
MSFLATVQRALARLGFQPKIEVASHSGQPLIMSTEHSPLLPKHRDDAIDKASLRFGNITVLGFCNQILELLASRHIEPFHSQSGLHFNVHADTQESTAEYETVLATFSQELLFSFDSAEAPSASSSHRSTSISHDALYLCALLSILLRLQVQHLDKANSSRLKVEKQVSQAREGIYQAIKRRLDSTVDEITQLEGNEEQEVSLAKRLFSSIPTGALANKEPESICAADLLLKTVSLPKTTSLRAILCHPVVISSVEKAWLEPVSSLKLYNPRSA